MPSLARHLASLVTVVAAVLTLGGCGTQFDGKQLTMTTGSVDGVYFAFGTALSKAWAGQLGIPAPTVLRSDGSVQNLNLLESGQADIAISAADAASDRVTAPVKGKHEPQALARIHDDYFQIVVRADLAANTMADLRGRRVSVGPEGSGIRFIAKRLLAASGMTEQDLQPRYLSLDNSIKAMQQGELDGFLWSGGLPTGGVSRLAAAMPLRLVNLENVLPKLRQQFPVYGVATVPAATYGQSQPTVTTLLVRNFLMVSKDMAEDLAEALTRGLFAAQPELIEANAEVGRTIDVRSGVETAPIPLHAGALRHYRSVKI